MGDHTKLSPSGAHRWMLCPGSIREEAKYPDTSGPAAVDGTHTHTLLEHCIKNNEDPALSIGIKFVDHEGDFTVDLERAQRVLVALNYVKEWQMNHPNGGVKSESRVDPGSIIGRTDIKGTADIILHEGGTIEVIDYKDGMSPVSPVDNPQMNLYGAGARVGLPAGSAAAITKIKTTIIQPKVALKGMEPISSHELTIEGLQDFMGQVHDAAVKTDDPNAPLVAGDSQCHWCSAKGACGAYAKFAMGGVEVMFGDVSVAQQAADKDPDHLSDEKVREIVESAPSVRQMLIAVEAEALRRFEAGHPISGLKAVHGRGSREWSEDDEAMATKLRKMGIPKGVVYVTKVASPAQVPKLTWEKRDGTKKQLSERQLKTLEKNYITKSPGKLTIVPESDHRTAAVLDVSPMFGEVQPQSPATDLPDWMK